MLKIRLARRGKKKYPTYRVVVSEHTKDTYADVAEILGHYNPHSKEIELKTDRIKHWMSVGAQPSDSVHNLLVSQGVIEDNKKTSSSLSKKRTAKLDEARAAEEEKKKAEAEKKKAEEEAAKAAAEAEKAEATKAEAPAEEAATDTPEEGKDEAEKTE